MLFLLILIVFTFCGFLIYCSTREHLLVTLLSLEFMVLGVFFSLGVFMIYGSLYFCLFYLILAACEGALGLSILVIMSRSYGGDYFKFLSFLQ